MLETLSSLIERLTHPAVSETSVINWGCPVPSFGELSRARVATLGLNPSNKEFVDDQGNELDGLRRRFHTLSSLGLSSWSEVSSAHINLIYDSCNNYFSARPYDRWFKKLDDVLLGTGCSFYNTSLFEAERACHLDLIPYATTDKWAKLPSRERTTLFEVSGNSFACLLRNSPIEVLILNGKTVVEQFQNFADVVMQKEVVSNWTLPRKGGDGVAGIGYRGKISKIAETSLDRQILVLGFNHNLQSSFGVTKDVLVNIREWIRDNSEEVLN